MGRWDQTEQKTPFSAQLQKIISGNGKAPDILELGVIPEYLHRLGFNSSGNMLRIRTSVLSGMTDTDLLEHLKNLPDIIKKPVAVFQGNREQDLRIILDIDPKKKHRYVSISASDDFVQLRQVKKIDSVPELKILRLVQEDRSLYLDKPVLKAMCRRVGEHFEHFGLYHVSDVYDKILDFDNLGKNNFNIDEYLLQVGGARTPYTGKDAKAVYEKLQMPGIQYANRMKETVFKDAVGYFIDPDQHGAVWKAFDFTSGHLVTETFNTLEGARNFALGLEDAVYAHQIEDSHQHHESEYIEGTVKDSGSKEASVLDEEIITLPDQSGALQSYRRLHGWTHDDPALIYSLTEIDVYFLDSKTRQIENIDNDAGIDAYESRDGFFMVRSEDYDEAYRQVEEHDRQTEQELKGHSLRKLTDFLDEVLPQIGQEINFTDGAIRLKYMTAVGEQDKWVQSVARVKGGYVFMGDTRIAVGIEHLTCDSIDKLMSFARFQLAQDILYERTATPASHFSVQDERRLHAIVKDVSLPKQDFLENVFDTLNQRFKLERIDPSWIENTREELRAFCNGNSRGEGLKR